MRIFRDQTDLAIAPALWSVIQEALDASQFFILLASPEAAASPWVQREIEYWLRGHLADTILIVLTRGEITWDKGTKDFDWRSTTALPPQLAGKFGDEPLHLDFREAHTIENLTLADPRFRDAIASLAAAILKTEKDRLIGEDVRHRRRAKQTAWIGASILTVLTLIARAERNIARHQLAENLLEEARVRLVSGQLYAARSYLQQVFELQPRDRLAQALAGVTQRRSARRYALLQEPAQPPQDPVKMDQPFVFAEFTRDSRRLVVVGGAYATVFDVTKSPAQAIAQLSFDFVDFDERNASLDPAHPRLAVIAHGSVVGWDFEKNHSTREPFEGPALQVGYNNDGSTLAVAVPGAVVLRSDGTELRIPEATRFVWHPAGRSILTMSGSGSAQLRDAAAPANVLAVIEDAGASEWLEFDRSGTRIVGAGPKGIVLWSASDGRRIAQLPDEPFRIARFSHDGSRIVAIGDRNLILTTSIETYPSPEPGQPPTLIIAGTIQADDGAIRDAIFDPTDSCVITAGVPAPARVWSGVTGERVADVAQSEDDIYENEPYGSMLVRASPDGRLLLTVGDAWSIVRLMLWSRTRELLAESSGANVAYSNDGKWLFAVANGYVEAREADTLRPVARWRGTEYAMVSPEILLVVDGDRLETVDVGTWAASGKAVMPWEIKSIHTSRNGERVLVASDLELRVLDVPSMRPRCAMSLRGFRDAALSHDGSEVLLAGRHVEVRDTDDCTLRQRLELGEDSSLVESIEMLDDDRAALISNMFTNGTGEEHRFVDIVSLYPLKVIDKHDTSGYAISTKPVGDGMFVDVDRRQGMIVDISTGDTRVRLDGQSVWVSTVCMSADGTLIATGDGAGSVKLWTAAGKRIATFEGPPAPISRVVFDPARERLLSEANDGSIRVWDIAGATHVIR
jgi:WD40 repeat protein